MFKFSSKPRSMFTHQTLLPKEPFAKSRITSIVVSKNKIVTVIIPELCSNSATSSYPK